MTDTRAEHLAWCKERALEYVDQGDLVNAMASMTSDLSKHEETQDLVQHMGLLTLSSAGDAEAVRRAIEGFQ